MIGLSLSSRDDLAWAAGLFEGEGSIMYWRNKERQWSAARMSIHMTDLDVLQAFHRIVGVGTMNGPYRENGGPNKNYKPHWQWTVATFEHAQALIAAFWPWLKSRRRAKALEVLGLMRTVPSPSARRAQCPLGHPKTDENVYLNCRGHRTCRLCNAKRFAVWVQANRARLTRQQRERRQQKRSPML